MENSTLSFVYDYFIKDHLGNVRMVLTEEEKESDYLATMEIAQNNFETALFEQVSQSRDDKPNGFDQLSANEKVSKLSGNVGTDRRIGPGKILKVMAGDMFTAKVFGWYQPGSTDHTTDPGLASILTSLLNTLSGSIGGMGKATPTEISGSGALNAPINQLLQNQPTPGAGVPKAYLNYVLLDESQLKYVTCGATAIPEITGVMERQLLEINNGGEVEITKNGYLYVYVSNESKGSVYFDDLMIEHFKKSLLEETHYYPFGLTMSGISSSAANITPNKIKFQEQELASKEFSDGSGLEMYEFKWRMHDPQTGRFWQIDPLSEKYVYNSTYAFSENKVTGHRELEGLEAWSVNPVTLEDGTTALSATVSDINAPFSVTQGGQSYGYFPNADMNRQLGGAMVSDGSLLVPVNSNGDYNTYSGEGIQNFNYMTSDMAATPTTTVNVITPGAPVVINGNRNATAPMATVGATTVTTPAINSATAPTVNLTFSDQAGLPNTFTVTDNSSGAQLINQGGRGSITTTANNFVSGSTMSVRTTEQPTQRGDGYNYTLTVTPTVSTPTVVPTPAATANQFRIEQGKSRSLLNNVSLY